MVGEDSFDFGIEGEFLEVIGGVEVGNGVFLEEERERVRRICMDGGIFWSEDCCWIELGYVGCGGGERKGVSCYS